MLHIYLLLMIVFAPTQLGGQGINSMRTLLVETVNLIEGQDLSIGRVLSPEQERYEIYKTIEDVIKRAGFKGEDYFVGSMRAYIEDKNSAETIKLFLKGVEESGVSNPQNIINLLYSVLVAERLRSRAIVWSIQDYLNYLSLSLNSFRSPVELPDLTTAWWTSPESTWNMFINGIETENWRSIGISLTGYIPDTTNLELIEHMPQVHYLKGNMAHLTRSVKEMDFKVIQNLKVEENLYLLEVLAETDDTTGTIWPIISKDERGYRLISILDDAGAKKFLEEKFNFRTPTVGSVLLSKLLESIFQDCLNLLASEYVPHLALQKMESEYKIQRERLIAKHDLIRLKERGEIKIFKRIHKLIYIPDDWDIEKMEILEDWAKTGLKKKFDDQQRKNIRRLAYMMRKHRENERKREKELRDFDTAYQGYRLQLYNKMIKVTF